MPILNPKEMKKVVGLSTTTIWRLEKKGEFPRRINLTDHRVGWQEAEVLDWLKKRPRRICGKGENS